MRDKAAVGANLYLEDSPENIQALRAAGHETIVVVNSTNRDLPGAARRVLGGDRAAGARARGRPGRRVTEPGLESMIEFPHFDPVAIRLGPVAVRWYGLMYLVGFAAAWWLGQRRARRPDSPVTRRADGRPHLLRRARRDPRRAHRLHAVLRLRPAARRTRCRCSASGRAACRSTAACSA